MNGTGHLNEILGPVIYSGKKTAVVEVDSIGWRPNSKQQQLTGYGKLSWQPNQRIKLGIEYSLLRNEIKIPGGLTDDQFETDSKASVHSRNWLESPWNVITASLDYELRKNTLGHLLHLFNDAG
ncbi:MAG: TonB-dependent receptor [Ferruginibacter sp.]|nr:TonB-dependent receptor [Ferruginibacter sp.]